jgi:hypothetical protein
MKLRYTIFAAAAALTMLAGAAQATTITFDTAGDAALGTVDRYAPGTFQSGVTYGGRTGVLEEGTLVVDGALNRPAGFGAAFYNTQGKFFATDPGSDFLTIDLYSDPSFGGTGTQRLAGFWGVGIDATNAVSAYGIVELIRENGNLTFRGWDNAGAGSWFNMGLPSSFSAGTWNTLRVGISGGQLQYSVNNELTALSGGFGTTSFSGAIVQVHNNEAGIAYNAHWDNFTGGAVPEPATWAMMLVGFGGMGAVLRSNRRRRGMLAAA